MGQLSLWVFLNSNIFFPSFVPAFLISGLMPITKPMSILSKRFLRQRLHPFSTRKVASTLPSPGLFSIFLCKWPLSIIIPRVENARPMLSRQDLANYCHQYHLEYSETLYLTSTDLPNLPITHPSNRPLDQEEAPKIQHSNLWVKEPQGRSMNVLHCTLCQHPYEKNALCTAEAICIARCPQTVTRIFHL